MPVLLTANNSVSIHKEFMSINSVVKHRHSSRGKLSSHSYYSVSVIIVTKKWAEQTRDGSTGFKEEAKVQNRRQKGY